MGRPLRKDVNGVDVIGTFGAKTGDLSSEAGIRVQYFDGSEVKDNAVIVKQRGARSYVCAVDDEEGSIAENLTKTSPVFLGKLQKDEPAAEGQIRIRGSLSGTYPGDIAIAKLTKRVATDFDGNRYNWQMTNFEDSTGDAIQLTPIV